MRSIKLPLFLGSGDPDENLDFREDVVQKIANFWPKRWEEKYAKEITSLIRQARQYGEEEIRNQFGKMKNSGHNVVITLKRFDQEKEYVRQRGDFRYASDELAEFLVNSPYDLLPVFVGYSGGHNLLDGHHRWRAYNMVGMSPLAIQIEIEPSSGKELMLIAQYEDDVEEKKIVDEERYNNFVKRMSETKRTLTIKDLRSLISEMLQN